MLTIIRPEAANKAQWVSDRRWFLDKDGNLVGDKDPRKLTLLVASGGILPLDVAARYGLTGVKGKPVAEIPQPVEPVIEPMAETPPAPKPKRAKKAKAS